MVEEVNPCIIYLIHFKNLCKCHNVSYPLQHKGNKCWKNNSEKFKNEITQSINLLIFLEHPDGRHYAGWWDCISEFSG
jgi:hypothetical protein